MYAVKQKRMMKNYNHSLCSTCEHTLYCSLTTDMSTISSCSEYIHHLENPSSAIQVSTKYATDETQNKQKKELLLN